LRLIVVDDEPSILFAIREYFTISDTIVDCASSFADAMRLLDRNSYDVVITDLHLSADRRAEGLLVLDLVRHRRPRARSIVLTGFASGAVSQEAANHGADACFAKPIDLPHLSEVVARLVGGPVVPAVAPTVP
jgi:DNA-binding NtrC family response regulator